MPVSWVSTVESEYIYFTVILILKSSDGYPYSTTVGLMHLLIILSRIIAPISFSQARGKNKIIIYQFLFQRMTCFCLSLSYSLKAFWHKTVIFYGTKNKDFVIEENPLYMLIVKQKRITESYWVTHSYIAIYCHILNTQ